MLLIREKQTNPRDSWADVGQWWRRPHIKLLQRTGQADNLTVWLWLQKCHSHRSRCNQWCDWFAAENSSKLHWLTSINYKHVALAGLLNALQIDRYRYIKMNILSQCYSNHPYKAKTSWLALWSQYTLPHLTTLGHILMMNLIRYRLHCYNYIHCSSLPHIHMYTHTHTHVQRPFFWDYLGEPVPER